MNTDSGRFSYTYDAAGQNTSAINPFGERTTFAYDASGRLTTRRLSNGTRTSYTYDAASRQTLVDNRTSAGVAIAGFTYKYDSVGNPTSMAETAGDRVSWSYDAANQLLSERRSGVNGYANTFTYDSAGNRTRINANSIRTTFQYDVANQLKYSQSTAGRTTFTFDSAGNQRIEQPPTGNRTTTTWNYENQPTQYQLPDASRVTLSYNPDNRRVSKVVGGVTSKFIWDPVTDAYHSELDAANATSVVYTQPPTEFGQVISQRRGSTSRWHHPDSLGSTRALSDAGQATTDTYLYDAWGRPLSSTGATVNPFRWVGNVGYYYDPESGLYYIRARVYQPTIARWLSPDPLFYMLAKAGMLGYGSKDPMGNQVTTNPLEYCANSPLLRVDPSGEEDLVPQCRAILWSTIYGWRRAGYDCAADLMVSALAKRQDPCPNSCKTALIKTGFEFVLPCLQRRMQFRPDCSAKTRHVFELSGGHWQQGGDIGFGMGKFRWFAKGVCEIDCSPTTASCCCDCGGQCGFDLTVKDDYDFSKTVYVFPHPLFCARHLQDMGQLKISETKCDLTAYGVSMRKFERCPGPSIPDTFVDPNQARDTVCERTMASAGAQPRPFVPPKPGGDLR